MNASRLAVVALSIVLSSIPVLAHASEPHPGAAPGARAPASAERCAEHGVARAMCSRCNPKLAAVYKAKGDWCAEHERPETQCVLCHPELAKKGVK
jgi:hypothetical protein